MLSRHAEEQRHKQHGHRLAAEEARRADEAEHWKAIDQLRRLPSADNAQAAKKAFRNLALRLHPDQGGSPESFIRLKTAYDLAETTWRRRAG